MRLLTVIGFFVAAFAAMPCSADQPASAVGYCNFASGSTTAQAGLDFGFQVQPNTRFHVLYATGLGNMQPQQPLYLLVQFGTQSVLWLEPHDTGAFGSDERYVLSQDVLAFGITPFSISAVSCVRANGTGTGTFALTLTGYLEADTRPMHRSRSRVNPRRG